MNGAFEVGAVALRAQQRALETIANNVANINTPTFKRTDVQFAEVIAIPREAATETERLAHNSAPLAGGVHFATRPMIFEAGQLRNTDSQFDIAIDGQGFIELLGPEGTSQYWRGGRLEIDRNGYLAAEGGAPLRSLIIVPDDITNIRIASDGFVRGIGNDEEVVELGQITLARPEYTANLERVGAGFYRLTDGSRVIDVVPGEDGAGLISQGMIESSNVEMAAEMIEMLVLQRAFAASAQVIQTADQISAITNNLRQ